MARPSRADRRRLNARNVPATGRTEAPNNDAPESNVVVANVVEAPRTVRTTRRVLARNVADSIDYTAEYHVIAHDLRRIAIWGSLRELPTPFLCAMTTYSFKCVLLTRWRLPWRGSSWLVWLLRLRRRRQSRSHLIRFW